MKRTKPSRRLLYLGALFFMLPLGACAVSSDPSGETLEEAPPEPFDSVEEKLNVMRETGLLIEDEDGLEVEKAPSFETFYVGGNSGSGYKWTDLSPNEYICTLSLLGGSLRSGSSWVYYFTSIGWYLYGSSTSVLGGATCTKHSNFQKPSGSVTWVSGQTHLTRDGWGSNSSNLWQGDAFHFVTSANGMYGGGENVRTTQPSGSAFAKLVVSHDRLDGQTIGTALSYFVGEPGIYNRVKLYGYRNGSWVRGNSSSTGTFEFQVSTVSGYSAFWLPPTDKAICAITYVGGDFNGPSDSLYYTKNGSQWYGKILGANDATGKFRCMAFDQR